MWSPPSVPLSLRISISPLRTIARPSSEMLFLSLTFLTTVSNFTQSALHTMQWRKLNLLPPSSIQRLDAGRVSYSSYTPGETFCLPSQATRRSRPDNILPRDGGGGTIIKGRKLCWFSMDRTINWVTNYKHLMHTSSILLHKYQKK